MEQASEEMDEGTLASNNLYDSLTILVFYHIEEIFHWDFFSLFTCQRQRFFPQSFVWKTVIV